jgi:hypothetical protein
MRTDPLDTKLRRTNGTLADLGQLTGSPGRSLRKSGRGGVMDDRQGLNWRLIERIVLVAEMVIEILNRLRLP